MPRQQRITLIKQIEEKRRSTVFCYLTSDRPPNVAVIAKDALSIFNDFLKTKDSYEKIDLFIFTLGGDTLAGFGLSRLFREYTDNFSTLIPDKCHSAGTLIALSSNEILMTKAASLSSIDPAVRNPLNPAIDQKNGLPPAIIPLEVESIAAFKSLVCNEWGIKNKTLLTEIFKLLSSKIHPISLGNMYKARNQIVKLATSLMNEHRNDKKQISTIVQTLTKELGSHDYPIYRKEAIQIIGNQITKDKDVEDLVWQLYKDFRSDMLLGIPVDNEQVQLSQEHEHKQVVIESKNQGKKFSHIFILKPYQAPNGMQIKRIEVKPGSRSGIWVDYD